MTLAAGTQIGKYIVRSKLAEGGMAEIYLANSHGAEGFEKEVVIKRIRSFLATDPGFVDMFIAEARVASRLNHANVVQIFDFEKHEDTYYLAMEYVRGCSLADLRKKCKETLESMPPVLVAHIGAEVARGLHYAHRLKVNGEPLFLVHRDVTPHNVLISFDGAVKLTDFGIAKAGNKLTSPGMLKGKFAYMSPEQSRGEAVDARTDVFALGIVLWEMLTGGRLFDGDSELAVLRAVQQSVIPNPARLNPDVPEDLDAVVMKALERDLDGRYQTAGELERALIQCVFNHAQTADDTDVSSFVRRVYIGGVPSAVALTALPDRTQKTGGAKPSESEAEPSRREPTAVMPGAKGRKGSTSPGVEGGRSGLSPDEDAHASTHLLGRQAEGSASKKSSLPPRVNTPGKPLPAVQPAEVEPEAPRYEPTVSLPTPAPSPMPTEAAPRRVGLWVGLGVLVLVAMVGVAALVRARTQGPQPVPGATSGPEPVAEAKLNPPPAAPPKSEPVAEVAPPAPAPATEAPPVAEASPDAGTADAGALAVTPTPVPAPADTRPAAPASAKGTLVVKAMPYATVLVNGKQLGDVSGQGSFKLTPGKHQLTVRHPKGEKVETITIEPNGRLVREFRFF
ncbi:serine/threonine protein kinase [Hyalangium rubrum]|uniref:Protein kinase n=1 Tax=Hyalangium rubrum TaxID=3103134 RepID=A0ABU5GUV9_9BACT|nr:protein kinase [Hyalangium sp. s54d21]MDY7224876.1 protein kinase [Hyalangium sp. s54d21]